jgi:hypothetical protein
MNMKHKLARAMGIGAAVAAASSAFGLTGVASASTAQAAGVTSVSHQAGLATAGAATASAAIGCSDNNRSLAKKIAASGNFIETASVYTESGTKITLRYSSSYGCAWGLLSGAPYLGWPAGPGETSVDIWLDRSADGGASWQGPLGEIGTGGTRPSTYTGTFNMANYNAIRACGRDYNGNAFYGQYGPFHCTPWFFPGNP